MKSLYESLLDDFDTLAGKANARQQVLDFLEKYCDMSMPNIKVSAKPNKDGFYEVSSTGSVWIGGHGETLTNGLFIWTKIKNDFFCDSMGLLKTLEGAPKEVGGCFICNNCKSLTSLEGAPKKCGSFACSWCSSLTSLKGAPKRVVGGFDCTQCDLKTLEGAPVYVGGMFDCSHNKNLTSLKGGPKEVGKGFMCHGCTKLKSLAGIPEKNDGKLGALACGREFAKDEVRKYMKHDMNPNYINFKNSFNFDDFVV